MKRGVRWVASLGVQDLEAVENAARSFSDQWAGTSKADFISAAYDIKSGIASLSDEGVAEFTSLAALTAKATKSTAGEMTSLFATGYGIYKDYYSDLSDMEFGEMFSAGISDAVRAFKTSGSGMAQAIQNLGASATTAQVPLEEQLSVLGMLQATMGGAEAGTKYKAFLRSATKGGEELGLKFTDANNQLLSMPEILDILRGKFGETMDAAEKMELQKAFGDTEAVALIDLMYNKVGDLQDNIVNMYGSLGKGVSVTEQMASAIQETEPERFERLKQRIHNVTESIGNSLLPTVNDLMSKGEGVLTKVGSWIEKNQELVKVIMLIVLAVGGFLAVGGTLIALISGVGLVVTKTVSAFKILKGGFALARGALTPLISSVWSFTAALLANPVTWVVIGIVALIAALVLFSFSKKETVIKFELVAPEETDAAATKVLVTPTWKIEGAVAKVEACNNGFDAVPTWEDITAMVQINRVYNFTNKTKTASKWGVNIRFTITKNEGFEGEVSISGFGGAYE